MTDVVNHSKNARTTSRARFASQVAGALKNVLAIAAGICEVCLAWRLCCLSHAALTRVSSHGRLSSTSKPPRRCE